MTDVSRRSLVMAGAALAAGTVAGPWGSFRVEAAAPPLGKQAPGFYRYKVGEKVGDGYREVPVPWNPVV